MKKATKEYNLSIYFPEIIKEWHLIKNAGLKLVNFTPGSHYKAWWQCCRFLNHEWQATIKDRTGLHKSNCPYCSGRKVCKDNNLLFLRPNIAVEWHPTKNGNLKSEDVTPFSNKKVWWQCAKNSKHEWQSLISNRNRKHEAGCPYCAGQKVCCENNLLYIFPEIAAEWHPLKNGHLKPENFTAHSSSKCFWWQCRKYSGHEWLARISNRTKENGTNCPHCRILWGETLLKIIIEEAVGYNFVKTKPEWLVNPKTNRKLEIDLYNEELNLAIEYQGQQHYKDIIGRGECWKSINYRDNIKKQIINEKNIKFIEIPEFIKILKEKFIQEYIKYELEKNNIQIVGRIFSLKEANEIYKNNLISL